MEGNDIRNLFEKFVHGTCSKEEIQIIINYLQHGGSIEGFPGVDEVLAQLDIKPEMDQEKADEIYSNILKEKSSHPVKKKSYFKELAAAAIFVGILLSGFFYQDLFFSSGGNNFVAPNERVTLQLENGAIKVIEDSDSTVIKNSRGIIVSVLQGNKLVYRKDPKPGKLIYHSVTVPYGKKFELSLADGTRVHLNAGTFLKYPINFVSGQKRQVFLKGEAFFDVAEDKEHPFIVNANDLNVQVLGTEFNVAAYPEDPTAHVVLVEGAVGMYVEGEKFEEETAIVLRPGHKGIFAKDDKSFSKEEVVTEIYTSWRHGELIFRNMTFGRILKKLERHYNVEIEYKNQNGAEALFNANFGDEPIEKVLEYFKKIYDIDYKFKEDHIVIN